MPLKHDRKLVVCNDHQAPCSGALQRRAPPAFLVPKACLEHAEDAVLVVETPPSPEAGQLEPLFGTRYEGGIGRECFPTPLRPFPAAAIWRAHLPEGLDLKGGKRTFFPP